MFKKQSANDLPRRRPLNSTPPIPPAFSYHASRSDAGVRKDQGRVPIATLDLKKQEPKSISRGKRWLIIFVILMVLGVVVYGLHLSTAANIVLIQPSGFHYQTHSLSVYRQSATKAFDSSLYNRFKPTISTSDIANYIERSFPEVEYVSVTVPMIGSTPTVYLQLQRPVLIYATASGNYLLDSDGVIIAPLTAIVPSERSVLYTIESSSLQSSSLGKQVLTPDNVAFIQTVAVALHTKAVQVAKLVMVPAAEELDVYPVGQPYFIKFNLHQTDALQQVGTYLATMATLRQQGKTPTQYIDVRVDGRAYYK